MSPIFAAMLVLAAADEAPGDASLPAPVVVEPSREPTISSAQFERQAALLRERRQLLRDKPGFVAPSMIMAGSTLLGGAAGAGGYASVYLFTHLGGHWLFVAFVVPFAVLVAIAAVGAAVFHIVLGLMGAEKLTARVHQREAVDAQVRGIDSQLGRLEAAPSAPTPLRGGLERSPFIEVLR